MRKQIGTSLIVLSILLLVFIYYPIISTYFGTPATAQAIQEGQFINIPSINAFAPVIENVNPWEKSDYEKALQKGVAKAAGFPNFYFAHSSLEPWEMTRINTAFLRLGELKTGDRIILYNEGRETRYEVFDKKEVWPGEVNSLERFDQSVIILQTCTPLGTDLKRLLIFARPVLLS